jgi:hypothetical protein
MLGKLLVVISSMFSVSAYALPVDGQNFIGMGGGDGSAKLVQPQSNPNGYFMLYTDLNAAGSDCYPLMRMPVGGGAPVAYQVTSNKTLTCDSATWYSTGSLDQNFNIAYGDNIVSPGASCGGVTNFVGMFGPAGNYGFPAGNSVQMMGSEGIKWEVPSNATGKYLYAQPHDSVRCGIHLWCYEH